MSAVPDSIEAKRGAFHEIPIIDFADAFSKDLEKRKKLAARVYDACVRVGFFYVKNHGVDENIMATVFGAAKDFFDMPLEDKMEIDLNKSPHFRGYTKLMVCCGLQTVTHCVGRECGPRVERRHARRV
jgi:isopenicillin N synthase-like dioxygenase